MNTRQELDMILIVQSLDIRCVRYYAFTHVFDSVDRRPRNDAAVNNALFNIIYIMRSYGRRECPGNKAVSVMCANISATSVESAGHPRQRR
jgi:hypothetical protein